MTVNAFWLGITVSVATGALVNEFCDVSPWLARRVMLLGAVARAGLARFRRLPQYLPAGGWWRTDGWLVAWLTTLCSTVFSTSLMFFGPTAAITCAAVAATATTVAAAISYRGRSTRPEELEPA